MLKRFARAEVQVAEETLVDYYRLSHGKKKNNMSEDQRERLLLVLSEHDVEPNTRKAVEAMAATRATGIATPPTAKEPVTPELAKVKTERQIVDLSDGNDFLSDYLSDSELNAFMDKFDQLDRKSSASRIPMKQTKLDFSKGTLRPPSSTNMSRTISAPSKASIQKPTSLSKSNDMAQLRADFKSDRKTGLPGLKRRAPVAPPRTDAFGRSLDAAGQVIELPRVPPKQVEESSSEEEDDDDPLKSERLKSAVFNSSMNQFGQGHNYKLVIGSFEGLRRRGTFGLGWNLI
jgi:hypothetical protein